MSDTEIFGAPKGENDLRPIGMGVTIRKLEGKLHLNSTRDFNENYFGEEQCALKPAGTESIIQSFKISLWQHPERCRFALDGIAIGGCKRSGM